MPASDPRLSALLAPRPHLGLAARVGIVVASWAGALVATIVLAPYIERSTFIFFWVAVLAAAWFVGLRLALVTAFGAVLAVNYLFVPPAGRFGDLGIGELVQLSIFLLVAAIVSALVDRLRLARGRLQHDAERMAELNQRLVEQSAMLEEQATALEEQAEELARQNEELRTLADEADAANRAKADFLATMSHELRTPINAALGYVDLLDAGIYGVLTDPQREALARVSRSQRRLLALVGDVLGFARLESSQLELHMADVALDEVLSQLEETVGPLARARGVGYSCAPPAGRVMVRADRDRLEQVLLNLLSNAIKFTASGGVVGVAAEARADDVVVTVRDTGCGIPADRLDDIFEPFVQVDGGLTRTREGTGLGLAISRALARAMGGDVTVRSTPGEGSTFTVTVPRVAATAPGSPTPSRDAQRSPA